MSLVLKTFKSPPTRSTPCLLWRIFLPHVNVTPSEDSSLGFVAIRRSAARSLSHDFAILVNKFEIVAAEQVGYGGKLRPIAGGVVV